MELYNVYGQKWSRIAKELGNMRTDNYCKRIIKQMLTQRVRPVSKKKPQYGTEDESSFTDDDLSNADEEEIQLEDDDDEDDNDGEADLEADDVDKELDEIQSESSDGYKIKKKKPADNPVSRDEPPYIVRRSIYDDSTRLNRSNSNRVENIRLHSPRSLSHSRWRDE